MNAVWIAALCLLAFVLLFLLLNSGSSSKPLDVPPPAPPPILAAAPKPQAAAPAAVTPNRVLDLGSTDAARGFLNAGAPGILLVYAPWCGHCKAMMPAFEAASMQTDVRFARLEGARAQEFMREREIRGFPTIFTVKADNTVERWGGGRDLASLLAGAEKLKA